MFYEKANSDSFCGFLPHLYKLHGRFVLFVDNAASYHKSQKVRDEVARYKVEIILKHILPFTPELNPVEIQWRSIKKGTANTLYERTEEEMKRSIKAMLGNGEVGVVKMFKYLTP